MYMVVMSRNLGGVIVSTLACDIRDVGLVPTVGALFPVFITPTTVAIFSYPLVLQVELQLRLSMPGRSFSFQVEGAGESTYGMLQKPVLI